MFVLFFYLCLRQNHFCLTALERHFFFSSHCRFYSILFVFLFTFSILFFFFAHLAKIKTIVNKIKKIVAHLQRLFSDNAYKNRKINWINGNTWNYFLLRIVLFPFSNFRKKQYFITFHCNIMYHGYSIIVLY